MEATKLDITFWALLILATINLGNDKVLSGTVDMVLAIIVLVATTIFAWR